MIMYMYSHLEHLFLTYWEINANNKQEKHAAFIELQEYAENIVMYDSEMDWMDDEKAAIIFHHVIHAELMKISDDTHMTWKALERAYPFVYPQGKEPIISPLISDELELNPSFLKNETVTVMTFGVNLFMRNKEHLSIIQEAYPAIERFLEQERKLFEQPSEILFDIPQSHHGRIFSYQTGEWISRDKNKNDCDGSFQEVCDRVLDF